MTELARGFVDDRPLYVGDQVMIMAEVLESVQGVGALVELYSKTDQMQVWVAEKHLRFAMVDNDLPIEPTDGTWLLIHDLEGMPRIFHRDDAEGHNDRGRRRHDQHWFDVVAQKWIDWPEAVARGAASAYVRRMTLTEEEA